MLGHALGSANYLVDFHAIAIQADLLIAEAERVEESQAKEYQREKAMSTRFFATSEFDVMADNAVRCISCCKVLFSTDFLVNPQAIITLDATPGNVGTILAVNPATATVFGYSRWQLERSNISMLMPQPIADLHTAMMQRFLTSGGG